MQACRSPHRARNASNARLSKAGEGDIGAIRELAERTGFTEDPAARGAINSLEIEGVTPHDAAERAGLREMGFDIDDGAEQRSLIRMLQSVVDPDEPPPVGRPKVAPIDGLDLSSEADVPPGSRGTNQHVRQIEIGNKVAVARELDLANAKLADLDADVGALKGRAWANEAGGRVLAFERADGTLDIVDGRQRAKLAQGAPEAKVDAVIFREQAGWSRAEVEKLAAAKNAREGRGGLLSVAEAMRNDPELRESIGMVGDFDAHAHALSTLSDEAWGMVQRGDADPMMAAMIGDYVADPGLHAGLLDELARAGISDVDVARRVLLDLLPPAGLEFTDGLLGVRRDPAGRGSEGRARSDIDDPAGAAAKKQSERLDQEYGPELKEAAKQAAEVAKGRDMVVDLRRDIGELEGRLREAEANRYADPETGAHMDRAEVDGFIASWRYLQDHKRAPKPTTLTEWVRAQGGLRDEAQEVRHVIGSAKQRPGLVSSRGMDLDDAARAAWEHGFFDSAERPTVADFLDKLDENVNRGNPVYRVQDADAAAEAKAAADIQEELGRAGIDNAASEQAIEEHFTRRSPEGVGGDEAAQRLRSEIAGKQAELDQTERALDAFSEERDPLDLPQFATREKREAIAKLERGEPYHVDGAIIERAHDELSLLMHIVPEGTNVGVLAEAIVTERTPDGSDVRLKLTMEREDGSVFDIDGLLLPQLESARAFRIAGDFTSDGRPAIVFVKHALTAKFADTLRGELWHEVLHQLRSARHLSGARWRQLVDHADGSVCVDEQLPCNCA